MTPTTRNRAMGRRRVTFVGLNSDEEKERSERGHSQRKVRQGSRRQPTIEPEIPTKEVKSIYHYLMDVENETVLFQLIQGISDHHSKNQEESIEEFKGFLDMFLRDAGAPLFASSKTTRPNKIQAKLVWLREKNTPFEELIGASKFAKKNLQRLGHVLFQQDCKLQSITDTNTSTDANHDLSPPAQDFSRLDLAANSNAVVDIWDL
jgi:hypothetical protein